MPTRADRRRKTKEGQRVLGEIRTTLSIDADSTARPSRTDWLDAIQYSGFYYEYLVKPSGGDESIYGIYGDFERTNLFAVLVCEGDDVVGSFTWG